MKQIKTVFAFTFREGVKKKSFKISSIIMALLVIAMFCVPAVINAFSDETGTPGETPLPGERTNTCYYIDEDNSIPGAAGALTAYFTDTEFLPGESGSLEDYAESIREDGSVSAIVVTLGDGVPEINVYTKDFMRGINADAVSSVLTKEFIRQELARAGLDAQLTDILDTSLPYTAQIVDKMDVSGYAVGLVLTMVMFFAIYFYGYGVAMSVASEKTSRVMETLIVSAKPSRILIGKCAAMGLLGLAQLAGLAAIGAVCYKLLIPEDFTLMGMPLAFSAFTLSSGLLILLYFVLGYFLYAVMNSVCGATVSRTEDLNTAMMPVVFLSLLSFYLSYFANIFSGGEAFSKAVTLIPFTAPFVIPFRLLNESVPASEIIISVLLLIVSIAVVTRVSIKIYSASVLHYGKRLKIGALLKSSANSGTAAGGSADIEKGKGER